MILNTTFNVGDTACAIKNDEFKIIEFVVDHLLISVDHDGNSKVYLYDSSFCCYDESRCFTSKEELLKQLTA